MVTVNMSYPKPRDVLEKYGIVTTSDTTARNIMTLPKDAMITGLYVIGSAVHNDSVSATLGVGSTTAANEYISGFDIKATTGEGYHPAGAAAVGSAMATRLTADVPVYAKLTLGGATNTGGPWTVKVEYVVPGSGETIEG